MMEIHEQILEAFPLPWAVRVDECEYEVVDSRGFLVFPRLGNSPMAGALALWVVQQSQDLSYNAEALNEYEERVTDLYDETNRLIEYAHSCMAQVETLKSAIFHVREAQRHLEDDYPHSNEVGKKHHIKSAVTALRQAHSILSLHNIQADRMSESYSDGAEAETDFLEVL